MHVIRHEVQVCQARFLLSIEVYFLFELVQIYIICLLLSENAVFLGFTLRENAAYLLKYLSENAVYALKMYIFALLNRQYYVIQKNNNTD